MAITFYSLIEATILILNAVCVLHEQRFLAKSKAHLLFIVGWGIDQRGFGEEPGVKTQILNLIRSIRTVVRFPLVPINLGVILFKLLLG